MICHKNCFLILIIVFGGGLGWLGVELSCDNYTRLRFYPLTHILKFQSVNVKETRIERIRNFRGTPV
jgi:hypothetical protein